MGARGPRPKLPALDRLDGNPGKRELPDFGLEASGTVAIPDHLHEDAQRCVEVIVGSMPPGVYGALDSFLLSAFATAWATHKRAVDEMQRPGFSMIATNSAGTEVPSPWLRILNSQAQLLASLGDRLGLNPKARAALRLPEEKPRSKFDGLIGGRNGKALQ